MSTICDDLRVAILQAAMQGKLTEQLSEDGNADELLGRIESEREKLTLKGRTKKRKKSKQIIDKEIPFRIPENWKWVRWGDIVDVVSARRVHQSDWRKSGVPFYRAREIGKLADYGFVDNELFIARELFEKYSESGVPKENDLMVTAVGTLGKTYVVKESDEFYYKDASVLCFENYCCNPSFLKYVMDSVVMKEQIESNSAGTTVGTLTIVRMNEYVLPLPPLAEQKRIVEKVDELMARVADLEKSADALASLKEAFPSDIKAALLQAAMQGKLTKQLPEDGDASDLLEQIKTEKEKLITESGTKKQRALAPIAEDEIPFDIPENWKWVRLGDLGISRIGLTYSPQDVVSDGVAVLRSNNISDGLINYDNLVKVKCPVPQTKMCERGDILICARNGSRRLVGKAAIVDRDGVSFGAFMSIFRSSCNEFVHKYINSDVFRKMVLGDANTVTINQITQSMLNNAIIPLPPLAEQKRIVERLDALMQNIEVVGDLIATGE